MFRNTGANAFAKNQMRLAYEDKRDLYCTCTSSHDLPSYVISYNIFLQGRYTNTGNVNYVKFYGRLRSMLRVNK